MTILEPPLGGGFDGTVLATDRGSAIKAMNHVQLYRQELAVYQHLAEKEIFELDGFKIPKLLRFDNSNYIIEMTIVTPPFVVDFAGARLTRPPRFDDEIMRDWEKQKRGEFEDDWPTVRKLMSTFRSKVVFLTDVHPRNVCCR